MRTHTTKKNNVRNMLFLGVEKGKAHSYLSEEGLPYLVIQKCDIRDKIVRSLRSEH